MNARARANHGFTLIEMLIAMFILSFIAMAVYNNTAQTYKIRDNVEQEGDFYNAIRVTLDVMGRDIAQLYTPKIAALPGDARQAKNSASGNPGPGTFSQSAVAQTPWPFWGGALNDFGVRPSRLQGDGSTLSFISNSHIRLFQDSPESDFAKITYKLEDTGGATSRAATTLVKLESTKAFEQDDQPEDETRYRLIQNVKKLEFKFLDGEKDQWHPRWDTMGMEHKDKFPDVIEVTLEVKLSASENTFVVIQRFRPEMLSDL